MTESVLVEAKNVAADKLVDILCPHIHNGLRKMYLQAAQMNRDEPVKMFQISLNRIPVLPENILRSDYNFLINESKCDEKELTRLIENLFICYAKLNLIAQGYTFDRDINLKDLEIPTNINFLHQCYINAAREIYPNAYLFSHKYSIDQQAQNREFIDQKITKAIHRTIRDLIPLNTLYNKYIQQNISDKKKKKATNTKKNNLESLMNMKIDTSFVDDIEIQAELKSGKLNDENLKKLKTREVSVANGSQQLTNRSTKIKHKPVLKLKPEKVNVLDIPIDQSNNDQPPSKTESYNIQLADSDNEHVMIFRLILMMKCMISMMITNSPNQKTKMMKPLRSMKPIWQMNL